MPPTTKDIFAMAWPLGLKAIMLHGIFVIDAYLVVGLGEPALAAMGLAGAVAGLLLGVLFAFSNATQIRIAQAFGGAGPVGLKTGFYCGLLINLIATGLGLIVVIFTGDQIIDAFAQTAWIAEQAKNYLGVILYVVLIEAVGQCLTSQFNGRGRTKVSFLSYLISLPINVAISFVLIYGYFGFPELGVVGAAAGSVIAALVRTVYLGLLFWREDRAYIDVVGWTRDSFAAACKRHLAFSWPIAATFVSASFGTQVCVLIYAKMSINAFAAIALVSPWVQVLGTFGMAWAQATGICVAQLLGQETAEADLDAFLSRAWRAAFVAAGLVSITYAMFVFGSGSIYDTLQPETYAALWSFLPILILLPFPKGSNAICGQTLRAAGHTVYVMNIFVTGQWLVKVPLTLLFVVYLQLPVTWVFALFLVEELYKFPLFHRRLFRGDWKTARPAL